MSAIELTMNDVHRDMQAVHDWLRAHDLDPKRTAPGVLVRDGRVTATLYAEDENGKRSYERDPYTDQVLGVKTETVAVELRTPVPSGLGTRIP